MNFLELYNSGLISLIQTVGDGVSSSPLVWSGAGLKIKALINILSLGLGAWPFYHFVSTAWEKWVTDPSQGKDTTFSGKEIKVLGLQLTATILLWSPALLGWTLGSLILYIIS